MTTFVASLHLPYTVHFDNDPESPRILSRSRLDSPKVFSSPNRSRGSPTTPRKQPPAPIDLPAPRAETPLPRVATFDSSSLVPNLLQTLGRSLSSISANEPTPPLTPSLSGSPAGEELFFKLAASENAPLGSPSEPTISRKFNQPKSRPRTPPPISLGENAVDESTRPVARGDGYFAIPTAAIIKGREKRSDSAASERRRFKDKTWTVERTDQGNGGLKNAVEAAIAAGTLKEKTWVGTLGFPTDNLDESLKVAIEGRLREDYDSLVAFPSDKDWDGHYSHFCKEILWPVFHYQIPDNPKSKAFLDHSWKYFEAVNRAVADVIIKDYKRGDTVWIHDYHLLLVPQMVREALGNDAKIGFFLHVAFPSSEIFRCLAHRKQLLEGMLGATLIGFQTEEYARHFLQTCSRLLCVEAKNDGIQLDNRFVHVINLPIGIDPVQLDDKRKEPKVQEWLDALKARYVGKKLLVARDKLDGVRGVRQKLLAFELFLKKHPEWVGKVVLIQVALTTTSIVEIQSTVTDIVTRINCAYSTLDYQPVVYLHQDISYYQYIALLTIADALVVTSLRDGMNLTSHEYVYCQDKKHGPLILSEFTGSASVFNGAEISVNPWDHSKCAAAIQLALTMSEEEKKSRWERLYSAVMHQTAAYWFSTFIENLDHSWIEQQRCGSTTIPRLSTKNLHEAYSASSRRLFILDYEGTLASWGSPTSIILTSPQRVLDVLNDLLLDLKNVVYIMSARTPEELERLFHRVPGIGLIAESGCFIRHANSSDWRRLADAELLWKKSVKEILDYYVERTPGTFIEERHCSYIWHHEKAEDPVLASRQAGDCCNHVNDSCENFRVHAVPIGGAVLVECMDWTKTTAVEKVIALGKERNWIPNFLMVAGDSRDDEAVFAWANELGREGTIENVTTLKVGSRNSQASATTTGVAGKLRKFFKDEVNFLTDNGVKGVIAALQKLTSSK
ncbi:Trehalose-6-P synthase/phosphatase complex subunit [Rhizina undulata]